MQAVDHPTGISCSIGRVLNNSGVGNATVQPCLYNLSMLGTGSSKAAHNTPSFSVPLLRTAMNRVARIAGHVYSSMGEQENFLGSLATWGPGRWICIAIGQYGASKIEFILLDSSSKADFIYRVCTLMPGGIANTEEKPFQFPEIPVLNGLLP